MATLKEEAQAYEPPQTLTIADLDRVPVDMELKDETFKEGTKDELTVKVFEHEGKKYRVPGVVLGNIKELLKRMPKMKYVSVIKSGTGKQTQYQVLPME